jgi:hypothetical protein
MPDVVGYGKTIPKIFHTFIFVGFDNHFFCLTAFNRLRLPFENGRFFDETNSRVIKEQSILVYFLLSAVTALGTIILTINFIRTQRNYDK